MSFWIVTDACCDMPAGYIKKEDRFKVMPMSYQIDGTVMTIDPLDENLEQTARQFYEKLSNGASSTTFQVNREDWISGLHPILEQGEDVLVLAFSSGLSGTCEAAMNAAEELKEEFPSRKIYVVDTLAASMGEGLLAHHVLQKRAEGQDIDACYAYAQDIALKTIHWFTVDDLHFLRRGGRVSAASAYLGSILHIKPVLNVDPRGKLIPREKVQGRKRSLRALFEKAQEFAIEPEKQTMFISHGDCVEEARWLADKLKNDLHVKDVVLSVIGPVVGSHSGPGTVALFFMGKDGEGRLNAPTEE